jgi:P27 family predicted phage terminase small subunit
MLRGNPSGRRLNAQEPQPPAVTEAFDTPPEVLADDALAKAEWTRIAPMMRVSGLVTQTEQSALIALCQQWSRYLEAQQKVRQLGMLVKTSTGEPVMNPYLQMADTALVHCQSLWRELGLTPSTRSRMVTLPAAEAQALSKWTGLLP